MKSIVALLVGVCTFALAEMIAPIPDRVPHNASKALLGKKLFHETALSRDGTVSCATCHILSQGGDDNLPFSFGIKGQQGAISAPTVLNSVFNFRQFWDGRAKDLKEQARAPIVNPIEMGHTPEGAVQALKRHPSYPGAFAELYDDGITFANIADAIAEFEKTLLTPNSAFDRYLKGEKNALSAEAKEGYRLFRTKGCILCHHGVNIGGTLYNKFGVYLDANSTQMGRFNVSKREEDKFVFKVPSLRNIALTAPYMHDGRAKTLHEAVDIMSKHQLGRYMEPAEIDAIVAFLESLTGKLPPGVKDKNATP